MITNRESGTNVHEIADGIYRINTPIAIPGAGAFSFNQYLIVDDAPMLFHTGQRRLFPHVREAVDSIIPAESLRYIGFSHVEADECGGLNEWPAVAPRAEAVCGRIAAMVSINDMADRPPRALADGEDLALGPAYRELVRHPAHAAQLGVRSYDGTSHQDIPVRRSVYTGRHRRDRVDRARYS
jgi:flavorubredoxin